MDLLLLSGNSIRNRDWIKECDDKLKKHFEHTYVQNYKHWSTGEDWINLPYELSILKEHEHMMLADYGIFAKSIGTVLALQAIEAGIIKAEFLFFVGIPLDYIKKHYPDFNNALNNLNIPITILHNKNDKVGTSIEVENYLNLKNPQHKFVETEGDGHDYENYDTILRELEEVRDRKN